MCQMPYLFAICYSAMLIIGQHYSHVLKNLLFLYSLLLYFSHSLPNPLWLLSLYLFSLLLSASLTDQAAAIDFGLKMPLLLVWSCHHLLFKAAIATLVWSCHVASVWTHLSHSLKLQSPLIWCPSQPRYEVDLSHYCRSKATTIDNQSHLWIQQKVLESPLSFCNDLGAIYIASSQGRTVDLTTRDMGLEFRYILGKVLGTQDHPTLRLASHHCVLRLNLNKIIFNTCILNSHIC